MSDDKKHPEEENENTRDSEEAPEKTSTESSSLSEAQGTQTSDDEESAVEDEVADSASILNREDASSPKEKPEGDESHAEAKLTTDTNGAVAEDSVEDASGSGVVPAAVDTNGPGDIKGIAAFFDLPDDLMLAAAHTRDSEYEAFEAYSPFPIHGMDDAMGLGRSWIPWVTFSAGTVGLLTAIVLQFGTMTFDWPMIIGGKPYAPWPSFVPVMFELTVLFAGISSALVMLIAAGCFRKPFIIDREITQDRFALWISSEDKAFDVEKVTDFLKSLEPVEIRTITKGA